MNFKSAFFVAATPALLLAACVDGEKEADTNGGETGEAADTASTGDAPKPEEQAPSGEDGKPDIAMDPNAKPAPEAGKLEGTWNCEDQGDAAVTFKQYSDGTATLSYQNMSEMAANQEASMVKLEATGVSAGYDDRFGRMRSADGSSTVWFLNDGRVEVTDGSGADAIKYLCTKAD